MFPTRLARKKSESLTFCEAENFYVKSKYYTKKKIFHVKTDKRRGEINDDERFWQSPAILRDAMCMKFTAAGCPILDIYQLYSNNPVSCRE